MGMIKREAQGIVVTLFTDGAPRSIEIENTWGRRDTKLHVFGSDQLRALHWALGEIIAADPQPDKN